MWIKKRRKQGQWYNRYIDETFNCVSTKFFNNIWHTMEKREGFFIDNQLLPKNPIIHEVRNIFILGLTLIPIPDDTG